MITDKGYHARDVLKDLEDSAWKSRKRSRRLSPAGRVTTRLGGTTTGRG